MQRNFIIIIAALIFTMAFTMVSVADVPPPPVNQIVGIPDTSFNNLAEAECRFCHEDPNIVDDAHIPNRHHLVSGTPVPSGTCAVSAGTCERNDDCPLFDPLVGDIDDFCTVHTDRPYPDGDTAGNYDCFSCHNLIWDPITMTSQFTTFRDCTECHIQDPLAPTTHHRTVEAQNDNCKACHGPIDNPDDGHYIPVYQPSLVTPCPSYNSCSAVPYKDVNDLPPGDPNATGGFCNYCHDEDLAGVTDPAYIGVFGPVVPVVTNAATHHSTGLAPFAGSDISSGKCLLCHDVLAPAEIRRCEACHGINSLHNIQIDSPAVGNVGDIVPGAEDAYWGHIGNNDDCIGCHGYVTASASGTGPVIPDVGLLSTYTVTAGTDTGITINGSAFTNYVMGSLVTSNIELTAADGSKVTLIPNTIDVNTISVTIPGTLAPGNYIVRAVKGLNSSNAAGLAIVPAVTITDVDCNKKKGVLAVNGSGFGTKPEGTDADISVEVNGQNVDIISWGDNLIKTSVSKCSDKDTVTVDALYGSATSGNGKPPKPCRGKGCSK
jgi:hypothetical protein